MSLFGEKEKIYIENEDILNNIDFTNSLLMHLFVGYIGVDNNYHEEVWSFEPVSTITTRTGLVPSCYKPENHFEVEPLVVVGIGRINENGSISSEYIRFKEISQFIYHLQYTYPNFSPVNYIVSTYTDRYGKNHVKEKFMTIAYRDENGDYQYKFYLPDMRGSNIVSFQMNNNQERQNLNPIESVGWGKAKQEIEDKIKRQSAFEFEMKETTKTLKLEKIGVRQSKLIDTEYTLCAGSSKAVNAYFKAIYPDNISMFSTEYTNELQRDDETTKIKRRLITGSGCETGFVVIAADSINEDGTIDNPQLLDGFMRVLWEREEDDELMIKVFVGLDSVKKHRLMIMANLWKIKSEDTSFVLDRGFSLYLWQNTGIILDKKDVYKSHVGIFTYYLNGYREINDRTYLFLWANKTFMDDFKLIVGLFEYRYSGNKELRSEMLKAIATCLHDARWFAIANSKEQKVLTPEVLVAYLDTQIPYLKKLEKLTVSGWVDNNIQANFIPDFKAFIRKKVGLE